MSSAQLIVSETAEHISSVDCYIQKIRHKIDSTCTVQSRLLIGLKIRSKCEKSGPLNNKCWTESGETSFGLKTH